MTTYQCKKCGWTGYAHYAAQQHARGCNGHGRNETVDVSAYFNITASNATATAAMTSTVYKQA